MIPRLRRTAGVLYTSSCPLSNCENNDITSLGFCFIFVRLFKRIRCTSAKISSKDYGFCMSGIKGFCSKVFLFNSRALTVLQCIFFRTGINFNCVHFILSFFKCHVYRMVGIRNIHFIVHNRKYFRRD